MVITNGFYPSRPNKKRTYSTNIIMKNLNTGKNIFKPILIKDLNKVLFLFEKIEQTIFVLKNISNFIQIRTSYFVYFEPKLGIIII